MGTGVNATRGFFTKISLFLSNREWEKAKAVADVGSHAVPAIITPDIVIKQDTIIRNKFMDGYARTKPVTWFVVHGTAGGGTLQWIRNTDPKSERGVGYTKGIALFHFFIDRDGTIWQVIDTEKWVWHASIGRFDGGTIGVELVNQDYQNRKPYSAEQYNSLLALYEHLLKQYPEMNTIISHNRAKIKVNNGKLGGKACPGLGFDWSLWMNMLKQKFNFATNNEEIIWNIKRIS